MSSVGSWAEITLTFSLIAWIIAESVYNFDKTALVHICLICIMVGTSAYSISVRGRVRPWLE